MEAKLSPVPKLETPLIHDSCSWPQQKRTLASNVCELCIQLGPINTAISTESQYMINSSKWEETNKQTTYFHFLNICGRNSTFPIHIRCRLEVNQSSQSFYSPRQQIAIKYKLLIAPSPTKYHRQAQTPHFSSYRQMQTPPVMSWCESCRLTSDSFPLNQEYISPWIHAVHSSHSGFLPTAETLHS